MHARLCIKTVQRTMYRGRNMDALQREGRHCYASVVHGKWWPPTSWPTSQSRSTLVTRPTAMNGRSIMDADRPCSKPRHTGHVCSRRGLTRWRCVGTNSSADSAEMVSRQIIAGRSCTSCSLPVIHATRTGAIATRLHRIVGRH